VFVHGLSGSWPNWLEQLPVFARSHRVIAVDLPGFGHSPMPAEPITIAGYAQTIDNLFTALGIESAVVVGHSMGGLISAVFAITYPRRVERLVLVSAAGISTNGRRDVELIAPALRALEPVLTGCTGWVASRAHMVACRPGLRNATLGLVTRHPSRLDPALAVEQLRGSGKPGFVQALLSTNKYPLREQLGKIACSTLIVWGEKDRTISVRDTERFVQRIPRVRKVIFEDTGHMAMLERPAQFNELLEEFLAE
jgi:pimeloyl-ACP methyl ester carboxylesterase